MLGWAYCETHKEGRGSERGVGGRDIGPSDKKIGDGFEPAVADGSRVGVSRAGADAESQADPPSTAELTYP